MSPASYRAAPPRAGEQNITSCGVGHQIGVTRRGGDSSSSGGRLRVRGALLVELQRAGPTRSWASSTAVWYSPSSPAARAVSGLGELLVRPGEQASDLLLDGALGLGGRILTRRHRRPVEPPPPVPVPRSTPSRSAAAWLRLRPKPTLSSNATATYWKTGNRPLPVSRIV